MKSKTLLEQLKQYKSSIGGSVLELPPATRQTGVRFPADAKQQSKKLCRKSANLTFFGFITTPLSKKRKLLKYSAEFKTSTRLKQSFHGFVQSFDEKVGLKSKTLFRRLK